MLYVFLVGAGVGGSGDHVYDAYLLPPVNKVSCGKVMVFNLVCPSVVILSMRRGGSPASLAVPPASDIWWPRMKTCTNTVT